MNTNRKLKSDPPNKLDFPLSYLKESFKLPLLCTSCKISLQPAVFFWLTQQIF